MSGKPFGESDSSPYGKMERRPVPGSYRREHDNYGNAFNARIRREYMDMANGDFHLSVFNYAQIPEMAVVFDLGCGDGTDLIKLNELGHRGRKIGLEKASPDIDVTYEKVTNIINNLVEHRVDNVEMILGDAQDIPLRDSSVDVVIADSVLQEVDDIDRALDEINRVLVDRGLLIIIENREGNKPLHHDYLAMMGKFLRGITPRPFSARLTHEKALKKMAERSDFIVFDQWLQNKKNIYNLIIKKNDEIDPLLLSLDTYRYKYEPIIDPSWDGERVEAEKIKFEERLRYDWPYARREVKLDLMRRIRQGGAREKIKRGATYCLAVKSGDVIATEQTVGKSFFDNLGKFVTKI